MIKLEYQAVDGAHRVREFKTIVGAQKFAETWMGVRPEVYASSIYAVTQDGVGVMYWSGCTPQQLWPSAFG